MAQTRRAYRKGDANYDPTTLKVPASFLDKQPPGQRQWWQLKIRNSVGSIPISKGFLLLGTLEIAKYRVRVCGHRIAQGNGNKLSSSQAQLGQATCLAVP